MFEPLKFDCTFISKYIQNYIDSYLYHVYSKYFAYSLKLLTRPLANVLFRRCLFNPGISIVFIDSKTFHATDTIIPALNPQSLPVFARWLNKIILKNIKTTFLDILDRIDHNLWYLHLYFYYHQHQNDKFQTGWSQVRVPTRPHTFLQEPSSKIRQPTRQNMKKSHIAHPQAHKNNNTRTNSLEQ